MLQQYSSRLTVSKPLPYLQGSMCFWLSPPGSRDAIWQREIHLLGITLQDYGGHGFCREENLRHAVAGESRTHVSAGPAGNRSNVREAVIGIPHDCGVVRQTEAHHLDPCEDETYCLSTFLPCEHRCFPSRRNGVACTHRSILERLQSVCCRQPHRTIRQGP
jgi:hypothetical protein